MQLWSHREILLCPVEHLARCTADKNPLYLQEMVLSKRPPEASQVSAQLKILPLDVKLQQTEPFLENLLCRFRSRLSTRELDSANWDQIKLILFSPSPAAAFAAATDSRWCVLAMLARRT
jgi:hypothetical protein